MSRTYKDVKREFRDPENRWDHGRVKVECVRRYYSWPDGTPEEYVSYQYLDVAGAKRKKRRRVDTSWHWYNTTPSWWTRLFMNRPMRSRGNQWARKAQRMTWEQLEDTLPPDVSRKPHIYYW